MSIFSTSPRMPPLKVDDCGDYHPYTSFPAPPYVKRPQQLDLLLSPRSQKQFQKGRGLESSTGTTYAGSLSSSPRQPSMMSSRASPRGSPRNLATLEQTSGTSPRGLGTTGNVTTGAASSTSSSRFGDSSPQSGLMAGIKERHKFQRMLTQLNALERSSFPTSCSTTTGNTVRSDFIPPPKVPGKLVRGETGTHIYSMRGTFGGSPRQSMVRKTADDEGPARFNPDDAFEAKLEKERGTLTGEFVTRGGTCADRAKFVTDSGSAKNPCKTSSYAGLKDWSKGVTHHKGIPFQPPAEYRYSGPKKRSPRNARQAGNGEEAVASQSEIQQPVSSALSGE